MTAHKSLLIPIAFTLPGLAVLLALGTWQLERKAWKEALIATLQDRLGAAPAELPRSLEWGKLTPERDEFRRVRFRADFRGDPELVYTAGSALRDDVKSPGYFVFQVGHLPGGTQVVVNRGYAKDRVQNLPAEVREMVGVLRWPEASPWFVTDHDRSADIWYVRDPQLMARVKNWGAVAPFYIEQESPVPPSGVPHPAPLRVNLPNNHLQYAITWYGLALALAVVFAVWMVRQRRPAPARGTSDVDRL